MTPDRLDRLLTWGFAVLGVVFAALLVGGVIHA